MKRIGILIGKRRYHAGQAMAEFAIGATVLMLAMFGIFMMGNLVFAYNTISSAAREGARFAIVHGTNNSDKDSVRDATIAAAPSLGLTNGDVTVSFPQDLGVPSLLDAKIVITYPYTISVPFMSTVNFTLTATAQMPVSP
jgi:Flp pilus assembly protein TadG